MTLLAANPLRHIFSLSPVTGYSEKFGEIMQDCTLYLMEKMCGVRGYTQSDEITVLLPPAPEVRGVQQAHPHNGRVQKVCSTAAALVTAMYIHRLHEMTEPGLVTTLCIDGFSPTPTPYQDITMMTMNLTLTVWIPGTLKPEHLPSFDCRIGAYKSYEEAMALIAWRVSDCSMNAISDAVYHLKGPGQERTATTDVKLLHLKKEGKLPLAPHQAHGTFFFKVLPNVKLIITR